MKNISGAPSQVLPQVLQTLGTDTDVVVAGLLSGISVNMSTGNIIRVHIYIIYESDNSGFPV